MSATTSGIDLHSSLLECQDIHERCPTPAESRVIPLLRQAKSLGLDLFHDVVTVQANVTANFISSIRSRAGATGLSRLHGLRSR